MKDGVGSHVGPDFATIQNRGREALVLDILMPNQSIAQGYETYMVETVTGETYTGVIGAQTPTTITLRHEGGTEDVISREDIKSMSVSKVSSMPEDLSNQISVDEMAGLLRFLTGR